MLDTNLIKAIRDHDYDPFQDPISIAHNGISHPDDGKLPLYPGDPKLDYVRCEGSNRGFRNIVAWDLGKIRDPSAIVYVKWRMIVSGRGRKYFRNPNTFQNDSYVSENFYTPVYQIIACKEYFNEDYTDIVANIRTKQDSNRLNHCDLVFDATGIGIGVEEQLRHLPGFEQIVGMTLTGGDNMTKKERFASVGKTRLLSDLQQVVNQKRLRYPKIKDKTLERLDRQVVGLNVEETQQGYYKTIDDRGVDHHSDLLIALAMAVAWGEFHAARYRHVAAF